MRPKLRRSQLVGIWGPGALVDLPDDAVIIAGLDEWPRPDQLEKIEEPRLSRLVGTMTGVADPPLYAPPIPERLPGREGPGITAFRFPEWYLVQEGSGPKSAKPIPESRPTPTARRLVKSTGLDKGRFEGHDVVPMRFVRACPRGHIEDFPWYAFVHRWVFRPIPATDFEVIRPPVPTLSGHRFRRFPAALPGWGWCGNRSGIPCLVWRPYVEEEVVDEEGHRGVAPVVGSGPERA